MLLCFFKLRCVFYWMDRRWAPCFYCMHNVDTSPFPFLWQTDDINFGTELQPLYSHYIKIYWGCRSSAMWNIKLEYVIRWQSLSLRLCSRMEILLNTWNEHSAANYNKMCGEKCSCLNLYKAYHRWKVVMHSYVITFIILLILHQLALYDQENR